MRSHGLPLLVAAVAAFVVGAFVGGRHEPHEQRVAKSFAMAWSKGDTRAMYDLVSDGVKDRTTFAAFRAAYADDAATATATRFAAGRPNPPESGRVTVPVRVTTRIFGTVRGVLPLRFSGEGDDMRVAWERSMAFPGVPSGRRLSRRTDLPTRATILAADGTKLAEGADRVSEAADVSASILGALGPIPPDRLEELRARGVPEDAQIGASGLERALDDRVRGTPGGVLLAGETELARTEPVRAEAVRSTIVPEVQRAAVTALAGRLGGVVAMHPRTGAVQAAAGIGFSGLQPPGSTFKIITLAGGLEERIVKPSDEFEPASSATLEGVELANANNEVCGGNLVESFAESCNSVFGPLGAKLGAKRLVEYAERFGFNAPTGIAGAATSAIPAPDEIGDDLAVGSSAIGQGRVQATPLQMAIVAATIAGGGVRPTPTLFAGADNRGKRVLPAQVARRVATAMRAVVTEGTGVAANIDGVKVAGKTGTAELRTTQPAPGTETEPVEDPGADTTAWFAAYAPMGRPRTVVATMLVGAGAGGETAAPAAKTVLTAALKR